MHTCKNLLAALFVLVLLASLGDQAQASSVLVVEPVSDAGPDQIVVPSTLVTLDGSKSTGDFLPLTYLWTQTNGTTVTLENPTSVNPSFTAPTEPAVLTFSLVVTDNNLVADSTPDEVTITVTNPPVADAGPDEVVATSSQVTLNGTASTDPDNDSLTYLWTQTSGGTVNLSDAAAGKPTFTAPSTAGVLTFSLAVTDSMGMADPTPDEVMITVTNPPVANAGSDQTVITSSLVTLDGTASSDPDGDYPMTFSWKQIGGPDVTLNDPAASKPSFTAPSIPCVLSFSLSVIDSLGIGDSTPDIVSIMVENPKQYLVYLPIIIVQRPPAAFGKLSPANGSISASPTTTLSWGSTSPVTLFEYCYDTTNDGACSDWKPNGTSTTVALPALQNGTTYYWQVRAWNNTDGPIYSDGSLSAFWSFTTQGSAWVKLVSEGFESAFPGSWQLSSGLYENGTWYDVTSAVSWGKRTCHAFSGSYGGWAVGGGSLGGTVSCSESYPDYFQSWMVYGPLNLSQVKDGLMSMKTWFDVEGDFYDYLGWGVSLDKQMFYGYRFSGYSNGWVADTIDLKNVPTLGNVTGRAQVWIGFWFKSDVSDIYFEEGVAVDDISLSVCNSASGCFGSPGMASVDQLPGTLQKEPSSQSLRLYDIMTGPSLPVTIFDPWLLWPKISN